MIGLLNDSSVSKTVYEPTPTVILSRPELKVVIIQTLFLLSTSTLYKHLCEASRKRQIKATQTEGYKKEISQEICVRLCVFVSLYSPSRPPPEQAQISRKA